MILLDTNVLSEPLKPRPEPGVIAWLDSQVNDQLCISAVSVTEMLDGAARLHVGARRLRLEEAINSLPLAQLGMIWFPIVTALEPYPAFGPR